MKRIRCLVTGTGNYEWRWISSTCASERCVGGEWNEFYDGGCDLFDCLSRPKSSGKHEIKRVAFYNIDEEMEALPI